MGIIGDLIPMLSKTCKDYNLKFGCTPFYLDAVDILEKYVDFFKISSYELLWLDLFSKCANTGKPVFFSTGMATKSEVTSAINCLINEGCNEIKFCTVIVVILPQLKMLTYQF